METKRTPQQIVKAAYPRAVRTFGQVYEVRTEPNGRLLARSNMPNGVWAEAAAAISNTEAR